jgi:16S rRNA C967 or C1407 C5-methylase (RsmB/RsmF family)
MPAHLAIKHSTGYDSFFRKNIQLLFSLHAKEAYKLFKNQKELLEKVIQYLRSNNSNSLNQR